MHLAGDPAEAVQRADAARYADDRQAMVEVETTFSTDLPADVIMDRDLGRDLRPASR